MYGILRGARSFFRGGTYWIARIDFIHGMAVTDLHNPESATRNTTRKHDEITEKGTSCPGHEAEKGDGKFGREDASDQGGVR